MSVDVAIVTLERGIVTSDFNAQVLNVNAIFNQTLKMRYKDNY